MNRLDTHLKNCTDKRLYCDLTEDCVYHYTSIQSFFSGIISYNEQEKRVAISDDMRYHYIVVKSTDDCIEIGGQK